MPEEHNVDTYYAAVGIPQGVILDRASGEIAGAVRRGGELVSLDPVEYGLWHRLLTPMTRVAVVAAALHDELGDLDPAIERLEDVDLVVAISPGAAMDDDLERLRPIPLGVGLGNLNGDPTRFEIQNSTMSLPSPVSVDAIAIMFWWEIDGTKSMREVVSYVASWLPELSDDLVETAATGLVGGLMANRLLYLDTPRVTREASDL
jgi:hypothetical protein